MFSPILLTVIFAVSVASMNQENSSENAFIVPEIPMHLTIVTNCRRWKIE